MLVLILSFLYLLGGGFVCIVDYFPRPPKKYVTGEWGNGRMLLYAFFIVSCWPIGYFVHRHVGAQSW